LTQSPLLKTFNPKSSPTQQNQQQNHQYEQKEVRVAGWYWKELVSEFSSQLEKCCKSSNIDESILLNEFMKYYNALLSFLKRLHSHTHLHPSESLT
jgi:hypothetical protein